jgi:hypothetical protein
MEDLGEGESLGVINTYVPFEGVRPRDQVGSFGRVDMGVP